MIASLTLAVALTFDQAHAAWTRQLQQFVQDGVVDYASWKKSEPELDSYLRQLLSIPKARFATFTRGEELAFLINAYNAYTVRLILDNYPLDSIRSIGLLPGAAFRRSFIPLFGEELSLNDLEGRLREFKEPRLHFAIVCASKSCPKLRSEAYRAADLETQLDQAARGFLGDPSKNRFEPGLMRLSSIFKWYRADFAEGSASASGSGSGSGSVEAFVGRYVKLASPARIDYLDYDWALNGR